MLKHSGLIVTHLTLDQEILGGMNPTSAELCTWVKQNNFSEMVALFRCNRKIVANDS